MGFFHKRSPEEEPPAREAEAEPAQPEGRAAVADYRERGDAGGLMQILISGPDQHARIDAAWALVELRDQRAVEALVGVASNQSEPTSVRFQAIGALGKLHDASAVDALCSLLNRADEPAQLQAGAAVSLGWIRDPRAAEPLARAWMEAEDERVQEAAGKSFLELGVTHSDYLVGCLDQPTRCARAAELLGRFADSRAVPVLETLRDEAAARKEKATARACKDALDSIRQRAA